MNTVGEQFWQKRKAKKITLAKASRALLIKQEHLEAIESGNWQNLPEPPFMKGFIKNYAEYLDLDATKILALYRREYDEAKYPQKQSPLQTPKRLMLTPNRFASILILLSILIFAAYLTIQYSSILSAPKLEVITPANDLVTTVPVVSISGHTENTATIAIEGAIVPVDSEGNFTHQYRLKEGKNVIEIIASKRLSPKTRVTRVVRLAD